MLGYIPSPIDDRDLKLVGDADSMFGAVAAAPPKQSYDLIQHIDWVNDQQTSNSCVWNGIQTAHWIRQGRQGTAQEKKRRLSRMFGYWNTRKRNGDESRDQGCIPREAWKAAATMGFCTEALWPFEISKVNQKPDLDAFTGAIDQQWLTGYYNLWGLTGRDNEARLAISQGHPVVFGTLIDDKFTTYKAATPDETVGIPKSVPVGRHMMCGVGYDEKGLIVANSWGLGWGTPDPSHRFPGGFFRMAWEWVNWFQATDFWAVKFAEEFET
jgi:hypothetical protein